jgi:dihydrofolate reductase
MFLIAARSENNIIGSGSEIPWRVKGEQRLFKQVTLGHTLVMGRKTFESIGRALPGRDTVVITTQPDLNFPGIHVAHSLKEGLKTASELRGDIFIAGGGDIYRQTIDLAEGIHLTTIHCLADGDVYFPDFDKTQFEIMVSRHYESNVNYTYEFLLRKPTETAK